MNKKKIGIICSMVVLMLCTYLLTACNFLSFFKINLQAPTLKIDNTEKVINWNNVPNAFSYDVYMNDSLIENVLEPNNFYNFASLLKTENDRCSFYVVAKAEGYNNSKKSNRVYYSNFDKNATQVKGIIANNNNISKVDEQLNISVNENVVNWNIIQNVENYYIMLFYNNIGPNIIKTTTNAFLLDETKIINGEIIGIRIGIKNANDEVEFSSMYYYNDALYCSNYGSDSTTFKTEMEHYYFFKGNLYDCYITSQEELNVLYYYTFVNKFDTITCGLSQQFVQSIGGNVDYAFKLAAENLVESCDYNSKLDSNIKSDRCFNLKMFYGGQREPMLSMEATKTQYELDKGYYDKKIQFIKRDADYNNFSSDKNLICDYVETSEQLYYAVENGTTPLFKDDKNTAYILYNKAKEILRTIISENMTDYEKALSIFDWICINSVYDHDILGYKPRPNIDPSFTDYRSFSLEGVLINGVSVCDGFSKTFALLCNMEGVKAIRVVGGIDANKNKRIDSTEGLHAWNKVMIDGSWFVVDITWSIFETGANDFEGVETTTKLQNLELLSHEYFLVSDFEIPTHLSLMSKEEEALYRSDYNYYYYCNEKYNGVDNLIVKNQTDLNKIFEYMIDRKIYCVDFVFDETYITTSFGHGYPRIEEAIKNAKKFAISKTNNTNMKVVQIYGKKIPIDKSIGFYIDKKMGLVCSISLINMEETNQVAQPINSQNFELDLVA